MLIVPTPGCFQFDHPQHMRICRCRQCGFCDVGGGGWKALADFNADVKLRSSTKSISHKARSDGQLLSTSELLRRYFDAKETYQSLTSADEAKRTAKVLMSQLEAEIKDAGLNVHVHPLWDDLYIDGYQNVSISPLHVKKGTYKDIIQWTLLAVYNALGSHTAWLRWLRRIDPVVTRELACFSIVGGRCKRRGLSGILVHNPGKPPRVRGGSAAELAFVMKFLRVLLLCVFEDDAFQLSEAFEIFGEERRGGEEPGEEEQEDDGGEDEDEELGEQDKEEQGDEDEEANEKEDQGDDDEEEQWDDEGPWVGCKTRRYFDKEGPCDGTVTKYLKESDDGDQALWHVVMDDGDEEDLEEDELKVALFAHHSDASSAPSQDDADEWAETEAAGGHEEDDWQTEGPWVGCKTRRYFEEGSCDGTVTKYLDESDDGDALWHVEMDDGDEEDLEEDELRVALFAHHSDASSAPSQADANEWAETEAGNGGGVGGGGRSRRNGHGAAAVDTQPDPSQIKEALDHFIDFFLACRTPMKTHAKLLQLTADGIVMMNKLIDAFGKRRLSKPLWHKLRHVAHLWRRLGAIFLEQNEEHGERYHHEAHL